MRTLPLAFGLAYVVCCAACGGRTAGWDTIGTTGADDSTGGWRNTEAMGGSSAAIAVGGSGAMSSTGGDGMGPIGGRSVALMTGGSGPTKATGGRSAGPTGGSVATKATGGSSAGPMTGGSGPTKATGGSGAMSATGGKGAGIVGGSGAMSATGGSGATKATGGNSATKATGGSSAATGGAVGTGGTSSTPITSCNDTFPFLGTWVGNILDFYFEPQEALRLVLSTDASGAVTGKFTWGDGVLPAAPQGADIPYPPGYWEQQTNGLHFQAPDPWPGFAYTIVRGAACDTTFRFGVSTSELWQDWCALQTPIDSGSFGWGCTLLGGGGSSDGTTCTIYAQNGQTQTYPLWKCEACGSFGISGGVCACDQNGCFANMAATQTFDLTYSVSDGTEILSGADPDSTSCSNCTVRLARQN